MNIVDCPNCEARCDTDKGSHCTNCGTLIVENTDTSPGGVDQRTDPDGNNTPAVDQSDDHYDEVEEKELYDTTADVKVEFKHHYLSAGRHGCIPLKVTSVADQTITKLILSAESLVFGNGADPWTFEDDVRLRHGAATEIRRCEFDIREMAGTYPISVKGAFVTDKNRVQAFKCSFSLLIRGLGEKPKIHINKVYGGMVEEIDLDAVGEILVDDSAGIDLGSLGGGGARKTADWVGLIVEKDPVQTEVLQEWLDRKANQSEEAFSGLGGPRPGSFWGHIAGKSLNKSGKAFLSYRDDINEKRMQIWTGKSCAIGKNPAEADMVCMLLPDNETNAKGNRRISREHCKIRVDSDQVILEDAHSMNGTFVEGRKIDPVAATVLYNGQVVSLGRILSLRYQDFRKLDKDRRVNRTLSTCTTLMDCSAALLKLDLDTKRKSAHLEAFRFSRLNNFRDRLEYLFLIDSATIGSADTCAVRIQDKTVSERHARLSYDGSRYYIEDLNQEPMTWVGSNPIKTPRKRIQLENNTTLTIGAVEVTFRVV